MIGQIAFETFNENVWKAEYYEYYYWPPHITYNISCNYYNPILFTYPIPTSGSSISASPFFMVFDSDSISGNNEIFIKPYYYYGIEDSIMIINLK